MLENLLIKLHTALLMLAGAFQTRTRRLATARRGAEFIEVALYAAIILAIAIVFRSQLSTAFNGLLSRISGALN